MSRLGHIAGLAALVLFGSLGVQGAPEETIAIDPVTGNYTITYMGYDEETGQQMVRQVVYVPATKIIPAVKSKFKLTEQNIIRYSYRITNDGSSRQYLDMFILPWANDIKSAIPLSKHLGTRDEQTLTAELKAGKDALRTPLGWNSYIGPSTEKTGLRIAWSFQTTDAMDWEKNGLNPGKMEKGFGFESFDLPGVGQAQLSGATPEQGFPDEGPDPETAVGKQFLQLQDKDFVARHVAVPRISVPIPFDATAVLTRLNKHLKEDLVAMKLADPVFADQLGRLLDSAADAASRNDAETVRGFIKDLRRLLKREHEDVEEEEDWDNDDEGESDGGKASPLIDKLAARVLDFDLKYIDERLKKQDGD